MKKKILLAGIVVAGIGYLIYKERNHDIDGKKIRVGEFKLPLKED